jgi:hypothetical protein
MLQHLKDRHMDLNLHTVWVDVDAGVATFPLWNLSGQMVGYHTYRPGGSKDKKNDPGGRYYTARGEKLIPRQCQTVAVWGMESWSLSNTLFVTEGIFDACRLTQLGISAVAALANDPDGSMRNWFMMVRRNRPVVAVCDNDPAGRKLAKIASRTVTVDSSKDLGDATEEYVRNLIEREST